MADRFPSIEDLDAGDDSFGTGNGEPNGGDFLSRERAALGTDADQFSTPGDTIPSISVQDGVGDDDLLGGSGYTNGASDEMNQFQSSFPAVDTRNERMAPGGTITGSTSPFLPGARNTTSRPYSPSPSYPSGEEPEVIKTWREERDAAIAKREDAAAARKESTIKDAQQAVDEFYVNYNQKVEKGKAQTRKEAEEFLAKREDTSSGGTSWERIAKLVDVRKGAAAGGVVTGKERFRDMLGALAKDQDAPGAKGY